jgi:hypothetical protein
MSKIIELPDNFIGKEDREKLESFGGHEIAHGRATRWSWNRDADGNNVFDIFKGGAHEVLAVRISRNREKDAYCATASDAATLASGTLEHVMAELDRHFARLHGESPA